MVSPARAPANGQEALARNLCEAMCEYARVSVLGSVKESNSGALLIDSGVNYAVFNATILGRPLAGGVESLEQLLLEAEDHYRSRRTAWSCWLCDSMLKREVQIQAHGILARRGLRLIAEHQGMLAQTILPPIRPVARLVFKQVRDHQTRHDFQQIIARVFALPVNVSRIVYGSESFWKGGYIGWVGYHEGRAVTTAATESAAGVVGLYSVATVPEQQGNGFAEAITRHSLEEACRASGLVTSILQSTPSGFPLYRRIGYRQLTMLKVYVAG